MNDCPVELLETIVGACSELADLRSLRAVNKLFCTLSTPRVFRNINVSDKRESVDHLLELSNNKHLPTFVKSLAFYCPDDVVKQDRIVVKSM